MADAVSVAEARATDRDDWLRLWHGWQRHMQCTVPGSATGSAWQMVMTPDSGLAALIARSGARAVGFANVSLTPFAWTGGPIVFLQDLFVEPEARGLGAGTALLKAVYGFADAQGAAQVFWMVDENDPELQGFYARHAIRSPYLRYMRKAWDW